jgi:hypothetical protein
MKLIDWQYHFKWHIYFLKSKYEYENDYWWEYNIGIGPIQTRWWGKVWPKLKRPPQYLARIKEILYDDLKTMEKIHVQLPDAPILGIPAPDGGAAADSDRTGLYRKRYETRGEDT